MKSCILFITLIFSFNALSQATYVDPNKRQKKGLLEEGEVPVQQVAAVAASNTPKLSKKLQRVCNCEKLSVLMKKKYKKYYSEGREQESISFDYSDYNKFRNEQKTVSKLVKRLRNKYDLEDEDCPYIEYDLAKYKHAKKAVKKQKPMCDVDALM